MVGKGFVVRVERGGHVELGVELVDADACRHVRGRQDACEVDPHQLETADLVVAGCHEQRPDGGLVGKRARVDHDTRAGRGELEEPVRSPLGLGEDQAPTPRPCQASPRPERGDLDGGGPQTTESQAQISPPGASTTATSRSRSTTGLLQCRSTWSVDQIGVPRWTRASSLTSSAARSASSSRADRRLKPSGRLTPSPSPTSTRQDSQELAPAVR